MIDDIKPSYYAIIPGFVRYDYKLSPAEKLFYGEITALTSKNGYCFATNKYFAELYEVSNRSISRWLAKLEKYNYIKIEILKRDGSEVPERRIYITNIPLDRNVYTPGQNCQPPLEKNVYHNNINNNKIDDLYIYIINNRVEISNEFYDIIEKLELLYDMNIFNSLENKTKLIIKTIICALYQIYNSEFDYLLKRFNRQSLINLFRDCLEQSKTTEIQDLLKYYKRTLINEYKNNST